MKTDLMLGYSILAAFLIWGVFAVMDVGGQRSLSDADASDRLSDYWMPRVCLDEGYAETGDEFIEFFGVKRSGWVDGTMRVPAVDRCYPAFALLPLKAFPASWGGAWAWTILSTLTLIGALCALSRSWWPVVLLGSMPVLYNIERGNQVALVAALIGLFLSWYRSEVRWKRVVAALAISAATCFKVSPVVLGALYLREKDWRSIGLCVVFTSVLFFVPWFFLPDGISGLPMMLENASENALRYSRTAEFGLVELWRTARVALHQDCTRVWPGLLVATRISQVLGLAAIAWGAWRRHIPWVVVGMMWAAGNMHYYGALYLLPVLVLEPPKDLRATVLWFIILCPFQLVLLGHSANGVLCNLAAVGLCVTSDLQDRTQVLSR